MVIVGTIHLTVFLRTRGRRALDLPGMDCIDAEHAAKRHD
jgi:hypothetical protein